MNQTVVKNAVEVDIFFLKKDMNIFRKFCILLYINIFYHTERHQTNLVKSQIVLR